jgi:hypothetical protein
MKFKAFLFLFIVCLPGVTLAQKGMIESCQLTTPVVVDADFDEWKDEWMIDPKGKFLYNICNDADNLYIRLKVSDDMTQRKIGFFGLNVFLNPKGKKIGKLGFMYPVEKDLNELEKKAPTGQLSTAAITEFKMGLIKDVEVLELIGLSKENIVTPRLGLMNGLQVFIKADGQGAYVYEAKIPFKAFRIDKSAVKVLGVAIVTGKMKPPKATQTSSPAGGGAGNVGYGGRYGMRGYGMGGYGQGTSFSQPAYTEWNAATYMSVGVTLK